MTTRAEIEGILDINDFEKELDRFNKRFSESVRLLAERDGPKAPWNYDAFVEAVVAAHIADKRQATDQLVALVERREREAEVAELERLLDTRQPQAFGWEETIEMRLAQLNTKEGE